jgi:hypothetical protein
LLDFHGTGRDPVRLIRPVGEGAVFLRRLADGAEWTIPPGDGPVDVDGITPGRARTDSRGAANDAFGRIFSLAFDAAAVTQWRSSAARQEADLQAEAKARQDDARNVRLRRLGGIAALGLGLAAGIGAVAFEISAHRERDNAPIDESHRDTTERNERIRTRNLTAGVAGATAIAAAGAGVLLLLWPRRTPAPALDVAFSAGAGNVTASWTFF